MATVLEKPQPSVGWSESMEFYKTSLSLPVWWKITNDNEDGSNDWFKCIRGRLSKPELNCAPC
jgi:hypothetical protein